MKAKILVGRTTAYSAKCWIARSRQEREARLRERDAMVRLKLQEVMDLMRADDVHDARRP